MASRWVFFACALTVTGCSWSRFSDVSKDPPVVLLNKPGKMHGGFGASVATVSNDGQTQVIVGGANGKNIASVFSLGSGTEPTPDATDTGSCESDCFLGNQLAGLTQTDFGSVDGVKDLCFVFGFSTADPSKYGLAGRCNDKTEYTLNLPPAVIDKVVKAEVIGQPDDPHVNLVLATDKDPAPALVAGTPLQQLAWYYPSLKGNFVALVPPGTPDADYGTAVASVRLEDKSRVLAVSAPESSHVWLFDAQGESIGCLGGPSHFGRTLQSGRVDTDDADELLIADDTNVTVISGKALAGLSPTTSTTCTLAALPPNAILSSFSCGSRGTVDGCPGKFGATIEVGDLDGDGDGEVIVGAPEMAVRGTASAGAVLVYDSDAENPLQLTDELFLSSAASGDHLGASLAIAHLPKAKPKPRDVIVAGAPGSGHVGVFYCSTLLAGGAGGDRCQ